MAQLSHSLFYVFLSSLDSKKDYPIESGKTIDLLLEKLCGYNSGLRCSLVFSMSLYKDLIIVSYISSGVNTFLGTNHIPCKLNKEGGGL